MFRLVLGWLVVWILACNDGSSGMDIADETDCRTVTNQCSEGFVCRRDDRGQYDCLEPEIDAGLARPDARFNDADFHFDGSLRSTLDSAVTDANSHLEAGQDTDAATDLMVSPDAVIAVDAMPIADSQRLDDAANDLDMAEMIDTSKAVSNA